MPLAEPDLPEPSDSFVQSFAKGLAVIRSFGADAMSQSLTEVATRTGLSRAGARRILLTLEQAGYVRLDGRQFVLTARVLDLGFAFLSSQPLWQVAEPEVERLVEEVQESSSVSVLEDKEIIYVIRVPTSKIMRVSLGVGSRLPVHCTSMGRVLLSGMQDEQLELFLKKNRPVQHTPKTLTDIPELIKSIRKTRTQGWCLVDQEYETGLTSIAAPIRDRGGRIMAAVNVSKLSSRSATKQLREEALPPLLETARKISWLLQMRS